MSNDLISRNVLMEGRVENDPVRIAAMCAPVAFDKEKVIDQLKEEGCIIGNDAGNRAIEIIEEGGMSENAEVNGK